MGARNLRNLEVALHRLHFSARLEPFFEEAVEEHLVDDEFLIVEPCPQRFVARDDLPDGGAQQFAETIRQINRLLPDASTDVLIPDVRGSKENLTIVIEAKPTILAHNLETVPRLYKTARQYSNYQTSLKILEWTKEIDPTIFTKSGIMLGLGETREEVLNTMEDLRKVHCDFLTIGQYLRPTPKNVEVIEYIHPDIFQRYKEEGEQMGFRYVASDPFVRSSFHAEEALQHIRE